ncbi:ABC transporter ATP-binding protein [Endozoicomonas sp. SM1973]|uniref:ABC transporter ATP-binding protein n=1 Tax=Spartinivicinus marinus TaxID=2994442 RepID=A0A853IH23_9GAMM|nr:ABC transporter ATP-binding protein [Spartinivicinus marinus]MCX4027789.1 ABC transporter ATP-binding protein [Spartinivicinus marinus]NYZ69321.1 ABC transporter ATP-binding protein [Spartinivicinus marinus]
MEENILQAQQLVRHFGGGKTLLGKQRPAVHAIRGINLQVYKGETLGVVGESGCGKSTLAKMLVGLEKPSEGNIYLNNQHLITLLQKDPKQLFRQVQYVFQDPVSALNPRKTISDILSSPIAHLLGMTKSKREKQLKALMNDISLPAEFLQRYPHELSGGQAQRVGIARALAVKPNLLVLDEPVSALDVSVQAQILNLLTDLKSRYQLTYVFISHDLSVVETISDRVVVMYFGRVVEQGPAQALFNNPSHHYTRLLLDSVPIPGKPLIVEDANASELPDPFNPPTGCAFAPRCPQATEHCRKVMPELQQMNQANHQAACHFPLTKIK